MARGERADTERSGCTGPVVWAVFLAACLGALFVVVWANRSHGRPTSSASTSGAPGMLGPGLGLRAALERVRPRFCDARHRPRTAHIADILARRGYVRRSVSEGLNPLPTRIDLEALPEAVCGLGVVEAETGSVVTEVNGHGACGGTIAVPFCGELPELVASGHGQARAALFVFPGLDPRAVERTGMPAGVLLAHAEAEALLLPLGWMPTHEHLEAGVPARRAEVRLPLPPEPASGCYGWVAAGVGLETPELRLGSRVVSQAPLTHDGSFLVAGLRCASRSAPNDRSHTAHAFDHGDGGRVWLRVYRLQGGPHTAADVTLGSSSPVTEEALTLPATTPDRG